MTTIKPSPSGFKQKCCYYLVRRKEYSRGTGSLKAEYIYYLAADSDTGIPFNARSSADEEAWQVASDSEDRMEVYKNYRPPSPGEGTY